MLYYEEHSTEELEVHFFPQKEHIKVFKVQNQLPRKLI